MRKNAETFLARESGVGWFATIIVDLKYAGVGESQFFRKRNARRTRCSSWGADSVVNSYLETPKIGMPCAIRSSSKM